MATPTPITIARGDGIGPEIMAATLKVLEAAGAQLKIEEIEIGKAVYERGVTSGIEEKSWESLKRTKVFLKSPITTPQGGGFKSLNVTVRKTLGLYANVRPCVSYYPFVETNHKKMDLVIVRENEEDIYSGIEYRRASDVMVSLKVITRAGCEKICRYAFEYARKNGRKKVTCMSKDNIMKMADGLFHKVYDEIAAEYPDIKNEHYIIDIGAARIATRPQDFDVIVTENLYGDIISDIAAEVTGSIGLGGSSNIGPDFAMFEAVHGSAPDIAGKGIGNPSGLLLGAIMMLVHIGQNEVASKVHNAWLKTIEDGLHTGDIFRDGTSKKKVGTEEFTNAVIERLGQKPSTLPVVDYGKGGGSAPMKVATPKKAASSSEKTLVGADLYINWNGEQSAQLAEKITPLLPDGYTIKMISNRGMKCWPGTQPAGSHSPMWSVRVVTNGEVKARAGTFAKLCHELAGQDLDLCTLESLYNYDGQAGYSAGQGE